MSWVRIRSVVTKFCPNCHNIDIQINGIQDALDGEYNKKQSWSGLVTQHNLWDFSIEGYDIENLAECRSDAFGNIVRWEQGMWEERNVQSEVMPIFELCSNPDPNQVC